MKANRLRKQDDQIKKTIQMLSVAIEQTADNVMITDKEGIIEYVNRAFEQTTGYLSNEVVGKKPNILKSDRHKGNYYKELWSNILIGNVFRSTTINKKKNGQLYYADQTITPIKDAVGEITHFISVWKDITERIEFEEKLKKLNEHLKFEKYKLEQILSFDEKVATINQLNGLIDFIIQKTCTILESRRCSLMLFDENTKELCIKGAIGLDEKIIKESRIKAGEGIAGIVANEGNPVLIKDITIDERFAKNDRPSYRTKSLMSVPIKIDNKLLGVVNVTDKVSLEDPVYHELDLKILLSIVREAAVAIENAKIYKELKYLTITDPMTSLYNYRYFTKSLDLEIKRVNRTKKHLCLLLIDIDNFKEYNDTFGHLEGDMLLIELGNMLSKILRGIDIVCRYAGDEFVVILPETDMHQARSVADKIQQGVVHLHFKKLVTLSIGIAQYADRMDRHDLILKADSALYEAKKEGKNKISAYD